MTEKKTFLKKNYFRTFPRKSLFQSHSTAILLRFGDISFSKSVEMMQFLCNCAIGKETLKTFTRTRLVDDFPSIFKDGRKIGNLNYEKRFISTYF